MQQGMLFHTLLAPNSGVNIQQILGTLAEDLDPEAFRRAWEKVVGRHPVLRTSFRWAGDKEPLQTVHPDVSVPLAYEDWGSFPPEEREERLHQFLTADRQRGFVLDTSPLLRVALFREGNRAFKFVWTFHHGILDGRSFAHVLREVFGSYEAGRHGLEPDLPHPQPFREYIEWLGQQDVSKAEPFWRQELSGFAAPTPLGVAETSTKMDGEFLEYGRETVRFSEVSTAELQSVAREYQVSLNDLVQGAWAVVLSRYSGGDDVVFGATRACRRTTIAGAESTVGIFINTLPVRARVSPGAPVLPWIQQLRAKQQEVRAYEHTPLLEVQKWSEVPAGTQLFDSIIVFDRATLNATLRAQGGAWVNRRFEVINQTNFPLTLFGFADKELLLSLEFDRHRFDRGLIQRMLGHVATLLESMAVNPNKCVSALPMLTVAERDRLLGAWNQTQTAYDRGACIHELFEAQAQRTPEATAVVFEDQQLTYAELTERANRLAGHLRTLGVGPEVLVGICVERSLDMVVALLGILKASGAYVPLDPDYPQERLAYMIEDSRMSVLVTQRHLLEALPSNRAQIVCVDALQENPKELTDGAQAEFRSAKPENLAYVIYTSGSTGKPKGVMVEHRNVVNFFAGMDQSLGHQEAGTWLAVTSISFDISVLELFWTLTRGFKVVIQGDDRRTAGRAVARTGYPDRRMDFSLFYFSGSENQVPDHKYHLLLEGARFADEHGFAAVWTPERHFHAFGGLYPNPSLTGAAVAAITQRVQIRAGSIVLPLHNPIRVAEEWAVVDNLSNGRVGISFASGWHSNDFVFAPENYADRRGLMFRQIETVLRLWRGEAITCRGGDGQEVAVRILPRPVRPDLPCWITAAGSPDTFRSAGEMGANLLTHLLGQSVEELAEKIRVYRDARRRSARGGEGHVTLMLHTFVERDRVVVREKVRGPFTEYLKTSVDLVKKASSAWSFAAYKKPGISKSSHGGEVDLNQLSDEDMQALLDHAFERYFQTSGLFGTPESCLEMVDRLKEIGVDEIACLIDFGVDFDSVLASLYALNELREWSNPVGVSSADYSIPAQIRRHHITHFQCTPSLARVLLADARHAESLRGLQKFLVGGEALPVALAEQLTTVVSGDVHNMYGPTEATIWSTTQPVPKESQDVTIGRPIANTQLYIVGKHGQPAPVGVPGELLIGGDGVARGYLGRPELTAERFVSDPYGREAGARLYRTGDLARYREDGAIEFLGRIDHQVKIRGHRIELGEIETVLDSSPLVQECVVVAREDTPGDQRLVAYVVPETTPAAMNATGAPSRKELVPELRDLLKSNLPDHMLPSAWVQLEKLPLTPNGKVDRKALPEPNLLASAMADTYEAPQGATEDKLACIIASLLGVPRVGRKDSFFDLGGHSLLAVALFNEIARVFGRRLSLATLFRAPTIEQIASMLETRREHSFEWTSLVPIQPRGSKPRFFCVHGGGGNVLLYRDLARYLGSDFPFLGLQSQGLDGKTEALTTIESMADKYLKEIREFQPEGPYCLGGYCVGGTIAYEIAQKLRRDGQKVALLALLDTYNFRDVEQPKPWDLVRQKLVFHLGNLARIGWRDWPGYLSSKLQVARDGEWASLRRRVFGSLFLDNGQTEGHGTVEASVNETNDRAGAAYRPKPYGGRLTVFKSRINYDFLSDPQMGWGSLAGSLEVVELNMNPHAMLADPYVRELADELCERLEGIQDRIEV